MTSYYPGYIGPGVDETNCSIFFPGGQNPRNVTINVDKDVTVGAFLNEWGQYGVDLNMTSQIDGEDSSITIKATNPSSGAYQFIAVISGVSGNSYRSYTQFTGGTVRLTGLNEGLSGVIDARSPGNDENNTQGSHVIFSSTTTLLSDSGLRLRGQLDASIPSDLNARCSIDLLGKTIIGKNSGTNESPSYTYYDLDINYGGCAIQNALTANLGGDLTASRLRVWENTLTNISGAVNLKYVAQSWGKDGNYNAAFHVIGGNVFLQSGANVVATEIASGINPWDATSLYVGSNQNSSAYFTAESGSYADFGGRIRISEGGAQYSTTVDICEGSEIHAATMTIGANASVTVMGKLILDKHTAWNGNILDVGANSYLNIQGMSASVNLGETGIIFLDNGNLSIDYTNELAVRAFCMVMRNESTYVMNSSNAIAPIGDATSEKFYIELKGGKNYLNVNANQTMRYFNFVEASGYDTNTLYIKIDPFVDSIMLDTLCNSTLIDTGSSDSERFVVIENFRNNLIHVNSQDTVIEWDRILADGWSDFRFEEDVNGGYWLTATQAIPEPATIAALFAAISVLCVMLRRRK